MFIKRKIIRVAEHWGFVIANRAYSWADLDSGRVRIHTTTHRDGKHIPSRSNRCAGCLREFRRQVLGHNV